MATIRVVDAEGEAVAIRALLVGTDEIWEMESPACGEFVVPGGQAEGMRVVIIPQQPGYWLTHVDSCFGVAEIQVPEIGDSDQASWWHRFLGVEMDNPTRGSGIRIGIIDTSFKDRTGLENTTTFVALKGEESPPFSRGPLWRHGEAVCRILGDRSAPRACAPIAPGAQLFFASASFTSSTLSHKHFRMPQEANPIEDLDPVLVQQAIFDLAFTHQVDLINLSLGTFEAVSRGGLLQAVRLARAAGVAVVCAAGNRHEDSAAFPASLRECIGVGAFGAVHWGPPSSLTRYLAGSAEELGQVGDLEIFYSPESAYGSGVDVIAPGVSVLIARGGAAAFDLVGTSFAAPVVCGLLAVDLSKDNAYLALARDERRAQYAESRLRSLCMPTGVDPDWEGYGAATLGNPSFTVDA